MLQIVCLILTLSVFASATPTTIDRHPYHVTIESPRGHICSGALIAPSILLTSASCTFDLRLLRLQVRAGSDQLRQGGEVRELKSLTPHKRYQTNRKDFDIAVGFLEQPFPIGPTIQTVNLPPALHPPQVGSSAVLTGWSIDDDVDYTESLGKIELEISVPSKCKNAYASHFIYITERMFCAEPASKSRKACKGHAGSPLVAGNVLIGLSAWEQKCASQKYPGIYTDVSNLKNWIMTEAELK